MPILKRNMVLSVHGVKVFLNLEAGITRSAVPETPQVRDTPAEPPLRPANPKPATRYPKIGRGTVGAKPENRPRPAGSAVSVKLDNTGVKPQNIICLFGYGRPGSTWLVSMMKDLDHVIWSDPRLGDHFDDLRRATDKNEPRASDGSVSGSNDEASAGSVRSLVLDSAASKFPNMRSDRVLVIKELQSAVGAPLLMEALPEGRMIVLVRDPRDVVASQMVNTRQATRSQERPRRRRAASAATGRPGARVQGLARSYRREIEQAKQAYDAHGGPKVMVRYEDLRTDTLGTLERMYSALGMEVSEQDLARAVRKHSFENMPDEKGKGKFHRKAAPGGWKEILTPEQAELVEGTTAPILDEFYPHVEKVLPFVFRPGTQDGGVFRSINVRNEYRLPESFEAHDIVVDIGANIGSFCYAALQRGSDNVYGFEPERDNYACAMRNLSPFGDRVRLHNKAVWRSDRIGDKLFFNSATDEAMTAAGNVFANTGPELETIAFDDLIREVTVDGSKRVRMLKIDCEGSEFPILFTSQSLHLIDEIRGEYHEFGGEYDTTPVPEVASVSGYDRFTITDLTDALQRAGFSVESHRSGNTRYGRFFATRLP